MKHTILLSLFALIFVGCAEKKEQLHVYIWSEYLDPEVVADFEKQFNCEVIIDLYESPDTMTAKMLAGGDASYDVFVPGNDTLPILVKRGVVNELNTENIPNIKNLDARFKKWEFNPNFKYGVPYQWGTTGILARKTAGSTLEETWGLLFDPEKQPGTFVLLDDMRQAIGAALLYKGHSINTTDSKALAEAGELLVETKKRALGFEGPVLAKNRVLAKEATAAFVYSVEGARAVDADGETTYLIPREGSFMWQDVLSIPARAPHPELAAKFINFILDPQIGARNASFNSAATPNKAAVEFVDPAQLKNPAIYPPDGVLDRLELVQDVGDQTKLYDELWTKIKSE